MTRGKSTQLYSVVGNIHALAVHGSFQLPGKTANTFMHYRKNWHHGGQHEISIRRCPCILGNRNSAGDIMSHCDAIRNLHNARAYLFRYYGGVYPTFVLSQLLKELNPTPYLCGICGQRHEG